MPNKVPLVAIDLKYTEICGTSSRQSKSVVWLVCVWPVYMASQRYSSAHVSSLGLDLYSTVNGLTLCILLTSVLYVPGCYHPNPRDYIVNP